MFTYESIARHSVFPLMLVALFLCVYFAIKTYIKHSLIHKIIALPTERSVHDNKMPTSGGIIFGLFHIIAMLITYFVISDTQIRVLLLQLCIGGVLILTLGAIDDIFNIKPRYKLLGQIFVALIMLLMGFSVNRITNPFGEPFSVGYFSILVTIIWYLLVMNSINLIDGLDGLAAGIAIISCSVLIIYAFHHNNPVILFCCIYLVVALFAFLMFNFPNAKIFMGDSGSLYIGYFLASVSIFGSQIQFKGLTTFTILVPITVLFIPIIDTIFTIARRFKNKQPIFKADKKHLHHNLLTIGHSKIVVTMLCWLVTFIFGVIALGYIYLHKLIMIFILAIIGSAMLSIFFYIYKKELFK